MAYTVRLVEDGAAGWFATMSMTDGPAVGSGTRWSAEFADLRQAESVLDVAKDLAQQFNAQAYTWKRYRV
jgi:hypothetical protein